MRRGICRSEIEIEIGTDWTNGTDRIGGKFVQQCDQMAGWFRWLRGRAEGGSREVRLGRSTLDFFRDFLISLRSSGRGRFRGLGSV